MDLDCIGSMVLARCLFPDHRLVKSRLIHPVARNLYNLYQNQLNFLPIEELKDEEIERIVIVDTRSQARVKENFKYIRPEKAVIEIFDHHPSDTADIEGAEIHEDDCGANTTLLGMELLKRGISVSPEEATIALTGIYADTGNFSHENVQSADFQVASFLIQKGASLKLVMTFLKSLKEEHQLTLFHDLLNRLVYKDFNGHFIILSYMELEKQVGGLAAVAEKIFEVENPDAFFAVFAFRKENQALVIARSQKEVIAVNKILKIFGGGGHAQAASALFKNEPGRLVYETLEEYLKTALIPAVTASRIMSKDVSVIREDWSLMEASIFLEEISHTGAPVINEAGKLAGFMTLRDIMKGRKAEQMHAPVKAYMTRKVISGRPKTTIREIETLLFTNNIGHLPIMEGERVVGIVTRSDYLNFIKESRQKISIFPADISAINGPAPARASTPEPRPGRL